MDTLSWKDKGEKTVSAEWYHRAQEHLAPYLKSPWADRAPRTALLEYEVVELPKTRVKYVKE